MSTLEKVLTGIILSSIICLLAWIVVISNAEGTTTGVINQVYQENGVTKLEFVSDSGDKEVYEYTGLSAPKKGPAKIRFFKPIFFTPKAIQLSEIK